MLKNKVQFLLSNDHVQKLHHRWVVELFQYSNLPEYITCRRSTLLTCWFAMPGVELRIWLKQGKEKRLPARKKRLLARIFNKSALTFFATKCDMIMRKSVGKCPIQKFVKVGRDKIMRKSVGKCPVQK